MSAFGYLPLLDTGARQQVAHRVVPFVAGVLEEGSGAALHRNRRRERQREACRVVDGELVEQRVRADEPEPLGQAQRPARPDREAVNGTKLAVLSVKLVVSTTSVSPSQRPRELPVH